MVERHEVVNDPWAQATDLSKREGLGELYFSFNFEEIFVIINFQTIRVIKLCTYSYFCNIFKLKLVFCCY